MELRRYNKQGDKQGLIDLMESKGDQWICYTAKEKIEAYMLAVERSVTYVAYEGDVLCGVIRAIDDNGIFVYICDLLVHSQYRCRKIGQRLMERVCADFPTHDVYVMSDEDGFYEKKGCVREGSVLKVNIKKNLKVYT